jgi:hypothetical protein
MENIKIGVIKKPIIIRKDINSDAGCEWGHVGMMIIIQGISDNHYNIADPAELLIPILALRNLIEEIQIEFKSIR